MRSPLSVTARLAAVAAPLVLLACAKGEPATPSDAPVSSGSGAPVPVTTVALSPALPATTATPASSAGAAADAGSGAAVGARAADASAEAGTVAAADPRCSGAAIDLTDVVTNGRCTVPREPGRTKVPASAVRVAIAAPTALAPGGEGVVRVTLTNTSGAELVVDGSASETSMANGVLGPGSGALGAAAPAAPLVIDGRQSTASADGKRSYDANWAVLGMLPPAFRVRVAPGGTAEALVRLRARGFLPTKSYAIGGFSIGDPPDPLPPGRYKVTLYTGIGAEGADAPVIDLLVKR
jgi:hypothetical protein